MSRVDKDIISRKAAINALKKAYWDNDLHAAKDDLCIIDAMTDWAIRQIKALPSSEQQARWEHYEHLQPQYDIMGIKTWAEFYKCSNCGFIHTVIEDFGHYAFCPNCGSSMNMEDIYE